MTGLCFSSDKDPGGLLLLPEKGDLAGMNIGEVLAVMRTLLSVAAREVTDGGSLLLCLVLLGAVTAPSPLALIYGMNGASFLWLLHMSIKVSQPALALSQPASANK